MPYQHQLQSSRFELKYIISEGCAQGIRDFVRGHLELDEHARVDLANAYPVYSLYLDAPTLALYWQTAHGLKNRFKLRIRFYDDEAGNPAFLEIKRRISDVICKQRAALSREGVQCLLDGGWPHDSQLWGISGNGRRAGALQEFCRLCRSIEAQPQVYVAYLREAYVSPESNQIRVTFDRHLLGARHEFGRRLSPPSQGVPPEMGGVILEMKFTDRFPHWMRELVQVFNLQRCSVPKYVRCVEAMDSRPRVGQGINGETVQWTTG